MELIIIFLITVIIYMIIDKYSNKISLFYDSKKYKDIYFSSPESYDIYSIKVLIFNQ